MFAGFWHKNFWPTNFWQEEYWAFGLIIWASPTSHDDVNNKWDDETYAYDNNTGTYARQTIGGFTNYLELILSSPIVCDRVRFWAQTGATRINVDVYYEGGWHDLYSGTKHPDSEWWVKAIPAGEKTVSKVRVSLEAGPSPRRLYEFDFAQISVGVARLYKSVERGVLSGVDRGVM
ncbi:hypothetical protein LCGC14_0939500 [marine sediment metagenome]|uniref:Uncharacterized protein n=1 Tax=marine sediment metagenome TaxID=412755 RepID=A0A0F9R445_9ZZZZ